MEVCNSSALGRVHSLETFGLVDGPGVRFVAFVQGCTMRCKFCHNPDTWACGGDAEEYTAEALFQRACRYRNYWGKNGGITVSGGEPLLQLEFVTELFRLAHQKGVHTALDTSGSPFREDAAYLAKFDVLMQYTDLFLLDLKEIDPDKHIALCGQPNENILAMARYLSAHGKALWIRHVLVPGLTDDEDGLREMDSFIHSLKTVERVEILPYHTLGTFKWKQLGIAYPLAGVPVPTEAEVARAEELLHVKNYGAHPENSRGNTL